MFLSIEKLRFSIFFLISLSVLILFLSSPILSKRLFSIFFLFLSHVKTILNLFNTNPTHLFLFQALNFLLILAFIMFKLKENTMNYYLINPNMPYDTSLAYNNYAPTYFYPTYDTCGVFGPIILN